MSRLSRIALTLATALLWLLPSAASASTPSGGIVTRTPPGFVAPMVRPGPISAGTPPSSGQLRIGANDASPTPPQQPLVYYGGNTMALGTTWYNIFWVPPDYSVSANYYSLLNQYWQDVAHDSGGNNSPWGIIKQYYDTT